MPILARPFPSFCAAALLFVLAGCSRPTGSPTAPATSSTTPPVGDSQPVQGDWVVQRIDSDVDTLNPITSQTANGQAITYPQIFEGMLVVDNYTLKLEPRLAVSWEISADQLTYTFHLRHGVRFHDGTPFTADDVKFSYDKIMDPKVDAAPVRSYFGNIKSCEVIDPYTVRFVATERYFKTLEVLGTYITVMPRHAFDTGGSDFNKNAFGRHPIGTGPYKFVRWETGSQIALERNEDYWGGPVYYPKRLVYQIVQEPYIAAQLLKKGEIDVFDGVSPLIWKYDLEHSASMNHNREIVYPYPAYSYMGFNLRLPLFSDIRVRHAIDLLIPRREILSQIYLNKYASNTTGYDPPSSPTYNHAIPSTPYDPALALQLLNQAGWKNDHGDGILYKDGQPFSFTILYPSGGPGVEKIAELMQESMRKDGIEIKLSRLEFAQLISQIEDWKFEAMLGSWTEDINGDPSQLWAGSEADQKTSSNFIGYKSAAADKLMAAGKLEYDDDKRFAIYRQLQQLIHDDYPVCFLFNPHVILLVSNRFQNVKTFAPKPCFDITKWWVPLDEQKYGH